MATTKSILDQIKATLLTYQNTTLSGIITFKRGVLPPNPAFPAIAVVPIEERPTGGKAGNEYSNFRRFNIEIYAKEFKVKDAVDRTKAIADLVIDIINNNIEWEGLAIDSFISELVEEDPIPADSKVIAVCVIPLETHSLEVKPDNREVTNTIYRTSETIQDSIKTLFETYYSAPDGDLDTSKANSIYRTSYPVIPKFPSITIGEPSMEVSRRFAGIDVEVRHFQIGVWTKLLDKEIQLDNNLDLVEAVKAILYRHCGYGINPKIDSIVFDMSTSPVGNVYNSTINWDCDVFSPN